MSDGKRPEGDLGLAGKVAIVTGGMTQRINRAIELLAQDQAIYYVGGHSGHVLTRARGREDAGTWADYVNVGMEHGAFDMTGLAEYMAGLVEGGPTRSGHRTPAIIVEAPVNGTDAANVRFNAWQFRQILGRGVHGVLLCQAEAADAVRAFVESLPLSAPSGWCRPRPLPSPVERIRGAVRKATGGRLRHRHPRPWLGDDRGADLGDFGGGIYRALRALAARSSGRTIARGQAKNSPEGIANCEEILAVPGLGFADWGRAISVCHWATSRCRASRTPPRCANPASAFWRPAARMGSPFSKPARPKTSSQNSTKAYVSSPAIARKPRSPAAPTKAARCRSRPRSALPHRHFTEMAPGLVKLERRAEQGQPCCRHNAHTYRNPERHSTHPKRQVTR